MSAPVPSPAAPPAGGWVDAPRRARPWMAPVGVGVAAVAAATYVAVLDPNTSHAFPLCPLRAATGIDCPACGSLRATFSLSRGDVLQAADHNLLFVIAVPLALVLYGSWLARSVGFRGLRGQAPARSLAVVAVLAVAFMVLRNLPIDGLSFLDSSAR